MAAINLFLGLKATVVRSGSAEKHRCSLQGRWALISPQGGAEGKVEYSTRHSTGINTQPETCSVEAYRWTAVPRCTPVRCIAMAGYGIAS